MTYSSKFYGSQPDWKTLLRELLTESVQIESDGDPAGYFWEITLTDERMQEFENMGLWDMNKAGWND
jgi:hypothetical protein|tara:strand:- start:1041 stop:1241 length:201 start_codon:yes stop_codon:yes gene_type:complete